MKYRQGFTLIEMLLSVACLGIILAMTVPSYRMLQIRNDLDVSMITLVQSLRRAQLLSQTGSGDTPWGVYVGNGSILIFKGNSYISRDVSSDEETRTPTNIIVSGLSEVTFSKLYGLPSAAGTITLTGLENQTRNVIINQKGMVDY
jgi:prepilin-type N-terminal cleavage/methylation domain-containing protein